MLFLLNVALLRSAYVRLKADTERDTHRFVGRFVTATVASWFLYPTWWVLNRTGVTDATVASLLNLLFDLICKGGLGVVLWCFAYRNRRTFDRFALNGIALEHHVDGRIVACERGSDRSHRGGLELPVHESGGVKERMRRRRRLSEPSRKPAALVTPLRRPAVEHAPRAAATSMETTWHLPPL